MNARDYRPLIGIPSASYDPRTASGRPFYRYNGNYTHALASAGAAPVAVPLDLPEETLAAIFQRLDGLCLAGGVDVDPAQYGEQRHPALGEIDPPRDATEFLITRWALAAGMPILGICRGIQLLNVVAGGSLYQDLASQVPHAAYHSYGVVDTPWERLTQRIRIDPDSLLARSLGAAELPTNSFHHQAVKEPAQGFCPVAWSSDGIVEGIELPGAGFVVGVQWHPEGTYDADAASRRLFAAFVDACREAAGGVG